MGATIWRITWRGALCVGVSWAVWRVLGPAAMVCSLPLFGIALARPLVDLASDLRHGARWLVWRPEEGRYYAFHGQQVRVIEDVENVRWVRAADVRRIVGYTASDGALALTYPNGWTQFGSPPEPYFSDEALLTHLRKESTAEAGRFALWAERTIAFPARRLRERNR